MRGKNHIPLACRILFLMKSPVPSGQADCRQSCAAFCLSFPPSQRLQRFQWQWLQKLMAQIPFSPTITESTALFARRPLDTCFKRSILGNSKTVDSLRSRACPQTFPRQGCRPPTPHVLGCFQPRHSGKTLRNKNRRNLTAGDPPLSSQAELCESKFNVK